MRNLLRAFYRAPKRFGAIAAVTLAVVGASLTFAWGPDRKTFTIESPAPYITFNSITNNPAYGDERNFMRVKPADAPASAYSDKTVLEAGKTYDVYIYYHNNAAANLGLVATNTTMRTELPAVVSGDTPSVTYISSPDANPVKIWDDTTLTSTSPMAIRMVPGSATIHNFGATNGKTLPDSIITTGTLLGYDALDGKLPGCNQYAGYVTFQFVADQPNFEVSKLVSKHGDNKWVENYNANPGETVDYLLKYKNTGSTAQNDVVMKDQLPANMTYVSGSTVLGNPTYPNGTKTSDTVTTTGLNIGNYVPTQNAWVIFSAKTPAATALACGTNTLTNTETVETKNGNKSDTAVVTIVKDCTPPKEIKVCRLSDSQIVTIKETEFDSKKYSKNLDDCKKIEVCRLSDKQVVTIKESEFDSKKYSKNLSDCKMIKVCRLSDSQIVTIKETEFDSKKYSKDLSDCQMIQVCRLSDSQIVTIKEKDFTTAKYSKNYADCKAIQVCRLSDKKVVVIRETEFNSSYSKNLDDCKTVPPVTPEPPKGGSTPEVLPSTGPEAVFGALFGSSAVSYGAYNYLASRRALKNARR